MGANDNLNRLLADWDHAATENDRDDVACDIQELTDDQPELRAAARAARVPGILP